MVPSWVQLSVVMAATTAAVTTAGAVTTTAGAVMMAAGHKTMTNGVYAHIRVRACKCMHP